MQDLNATMFYKAKFHIAAIEENLDLLWRIVLHIREWMNSKWNASWEVVPCDCGCWTKLKYGGRIFSTDEKKSVYTPDEICYESPLSKGLIIGRDSSRAQLNFP